MPSKSGKKNAGIFGLAGGVVSAIAGIATKSTNNHVGLGLIAVGAILLVFGAMLWYSVRSDGTRRRRKVRLDPAKLAASLDDGQRLVFDAALPGVANEVANIVDVPADLVRANLFAQVPGTNRIGMVADLWFQMNDESERTIRMDIGSGSAGTAFASRNLNRAIWKDGWGRNDIGDNAELEKVNPELRWILSAPVFASDGTAAKLVLNVDGLRETPTADRLADAIGHLPRFANLIAKTLDL